MSQKYLNPTKEMKKIKNKSLLLGRMLQKIAPRIGASIFLEPEWGIAGQITFKSGNKSYFRYNTVDLNPVGSSDIAKDKDYSNLFMKRMGYQIVPGSKTFFSDNWAAAIRAKNRTMPDACLYAKKIGFPVVVKPNSGSQGSGVAVVQNKQEMVRALRLVFKQDRVALVQKPVRGKDYRIVVLDDKVISAYERIPLNVIGNGKSNILQLLKARQKYFYKINRDTTIRTGDPRISTKLKHQRKSFQTVPAKNEQIFLLDNANLSTGGDSVDVTDIIDPSFRKLAIQLTKDMGLRICGVDLIIDGSIEKETSNYWILEINAAPGLDHYVTTGKKQEQIVEDLYLQVLQSLDKK